MVSRSPIARLTDIIEAIERMQGVLRDVPLTTFAADWQARWVVERGAEIISEASRWLPGEMKARHSEIPWSKVAGIGNVLRHDYQAVSAPIMWTLVRDDLPPLDRVCREELAAEQAREQDGR
jgi:uncharacterized protein with HEPN domain